MPVQSYPPSHDNPEWEHVFLSLDNAEVDTACQVWFEQWCKVDGLYADQAKHYFGCMSALHALSNRTTADLDVFLDCLDNRADPLRKEVGYIWARSIFTASIAAIGWEGFAIRCATDPRGYAGYMQFIEKNGMYTHIDDLADHPHAGQKLKEALDIYGSQLAYPWIGAACIRWAVFGQDTNLEDLPQGVQWIKARYTERQKTRHWGPREVLGEPIDFGEYADVIKVLLQSPELWNHMFLQENRGMWGETTARLWLHWADSVGYECTKERQLYDNAEYEALNNCLLKGDKTELEIMRLMEGRDYLLQKALRRHSTTPEKFELPSGVESSAPGP